MTASGDGDERPERMLTACLRDPARGRRRLPAIVGLLDADERRVRLSAAWACCLVASAYPDTVSYLVRRLADRLDGEATLELTHTLDYLADRYPDTVDDVLDELEAEAEAAASRRSRHGTDTGSFTRNYYYDTEPTRDGIGRIRVPGGADDDPRVAYTTDEVDDDRRESAGTESDDDADAEEGDDEGGGSMVRRTPDVSSIAVRSRFDQLHVLASQRRSRFSEDYDALVGRGSEEEAVALRLLHLPADAGDRPAFEDASGDHLRRWASVDDHEHVVSLHDWGQEPRPWLVTSFAGESLAEMGSRTREQALHDAIALADAVASCHRADVVHAGIDPGNVAYPGDVLDANDQQPPLLNNVGLVALYRYHRNPADLLDPRYAAPEYYERRFGQIDAATDVYGLGAVVYRLFTGQPPVHGTFDAVKAAVTGPDAPAPSDVEERLPPRIDDVVGKAMATQKLHRYDTVEHLRQDLVGMQEDGLA